jgi:hypothetical protein
MNGIKIIFITAELLMLSGVAIISFFTDWARMADSGELWKFQLLLVVMSVAAVTFQKEQQDIEWELEDEEYVRDI